MSWRQKPEKIEQLVRIKQINTWNHFILLSTIVMHHISWSVDVRVWRLHVPMKKVSGAPSPVSSSTVSGSNLSQSPTASTNRPDSWRAINHIIINLVISTYFLTFLNKKKHSFISHEYVAPQFSHKSLHSWTLNQPSCVFVSVLALAD